MSQIKNLRLKIDDLKSRLGKDHQEHTESSEEESSEEENEAPKK